MNVILSFSCYIIVGCDGMKNKRNRFIVIGGIFLFIFVLLAVFSIYKLKDIVFDEQSNTSSIDDNNRKVFNSKSVFIDNKSIQFVHYFFDDNLYRTYLELIVDNKIIGTYILYDDSVAFNYCYNCSNEEDVIDDEYLKERFKNLYNNYYRLEQIDDDNYAFSYRSFGSEFDKGDVVIVFNNDFAEIEKIGLDFSSGFEFDDSNLNSKLLDVNRKYFIESGYLYFYDYPCNTMNADGKVPIYRLVINGNIVKREIINYYSGKLIGEKC